MTYVLIFEDEIYHRQYHETMKIRIHDDELLSVCDCVCCLADAATTPYLIPRLHSDHPRT